MPHRPTFLDETATDPIPLARESVRAEQRLRILRAMVHLCAEEGYTAVTVDALATAAGLSRATFAEHFADKEAVYLACHEKAAEAFFGSIFAAAARWREDPDRVRSFRGLYHAIMAEYFSAVAADPDVAHAYCVDVFAAGGASVAHRRAANKRTADAIAGAHAAYGGRPLMDQEADFLVDMIVGITTTRIAAGDAEELASVADTYVDAVVQWLGSPLLETPPPPATVAPQPSPFLGDVSGPTPLDREAVGAAQRRRLVRALVALCARKGYASVELEDVLQEAQLTREVFLSHFEDKEACYLAAMELTSARFSEVLAQSVARWEAEGGGPRSFEALYERMLAEHFTTLAADPDLARSYAVDPFIAGPLPALKRRETAARTTRTLTAIHEGLGGRELLPGEAALLVDMTIGIMLNRIANGEVAALPGLAPQIARIVATWLSAPLVEPDRTGGQA